MNLGPRRTTAEENNTGQNPRTQIPRWTNGFGTASGQPIAGHTIRRNPSQGTSWAGRLLRAPRYPLRGGTHVSRLRWLLSYGDPRHGTGHAANLPEGELRQLAGLDSPCSQLYDSNKGLHNRCLLQLFLLDSAPTSVISEAKNANLVSVPFSPRTVLDRRRAGLLLHPTSLPGPFDFGVLGAEAYRFVDFLRDAGFSVWQTLPLNPVDDTLSPYLMKSTRAGNPRLISLDMKPEVSWRPSNDELDASRNWKDRREVLRQTYDRFRLQATAAEREDLASFVRTAKEWLFPFAVFESLKTEFHGHCWWEWPKPLRQRDPAAIDLAGIQHRNAIHQIEFEQYLFHQQWDTLRHYAHANGVQLFGDVPIYVALDSVEVWWRRELFQVDEDGRPAAVSGVPPDYFSDDGQLWGNPLYDWDRMRAEGFRWWVDRLRHQLSQFDLLRIDHFRALESYWAVPSDAPTARSGQWAPGPGDAFLEALTNAVPSGVLVAEDLGIITSEVRALRERWKLPGMLVLQFAFDGSPDNPFLPENHMKHAVVYTGTHDNNTIMGWYDSLREDARRLVDRLLAIPPNHMPRAMIQTAYASPAVLSVVPMQDLLALGSEHRMNTPGTLEGNWEWRFQWDDIHRGVAAEYRSLAEAFGRL
jgi:4-alpha-glucanotransferase